ncbi:MAG: helix-turn-helix domain-containing protein [Nocardiaceae bacterium]|nr:helix-turn-helix domain-containing protein [Nocardiaceae bacterium]
MRSTVGRVLTLRLHGDLDFDAVDDVERELTHVLATASDTSPPLRTIVLDLHDLRFLSIAGGRAIQRFIALIADHGLEARVMFPTRHVVSRVLALCGVADSRARTAPSAKLTSSARRQILDVADTESARELLSSAYGRLRLEARGSGRGMRLSTTSVGPVRVDQVDLRMAFHAETGPLGTYAFGQLKSGRIRRRSQRSDREHRPGDVFLTAQPDEQFVSDIDCAAVDLAVISKDVFGQVTQADEPLEFTGYDPVSAAAASRWKRTFAFVMGSILADPQATGPSFVAAQAARLLAATALETFPNTAFTEPTTIDRHDAHPRTIARAIGFIESNADRDIAVTDIAREAAVTTRAMQLAFRRHLDTTPADYLRRVRLHRAHDDLIAADPLATTVSAIAARWGYLNASHFARQYQLVFNETPSQTLAR